MDVINKLFVNVKINDVIRVFHEPTSSWMSGKVQEIDETIITMYALNPVENRWTIEPYMEKAVVVMLIDDICVVEKYEIVAE